MGQNSRREPRAKVLSMTVRYRSATLGEFIEHHSYDVSRGGMFIKTPAPFPPGTLLKFEVKIADDQRLMQGVGRVVWKREKSDEAEELPAGMGIKFIKIDDASQGVIERLVESRGEGKEGAFDGKQPKPSQRMFPDRGPSSIPAPRDAAELRPSQPPAGDAAEAPPPEGIAGGARSSLSEGSSLSEARTPSKRSKQGRGAAKSKGEEPTSPSRGGEASSRKPKSDSGKPPIRGPIVFLVIVVALALFYLLGGPSGGPSGWRQEPGAAPVGLALGPAPSSGERASAARREESGVARGLPPHCFRE